MLAYIMSHAHAPTTPVDNEKTRDKKMKKKWEQIRDTFCWTGLSSIVQTNNREKVTYLFFINVIHLICL